MNNLTDSNWLLSVGTFLPLPARSIIMFGTSKDDERDAEDRRHLHRRRHAGHRYLTLVLFDFDQSRNLQFFVDVQWIDVISSGYTIGLDGISLPLYFLSMVVTFLVMIYTWDNMPDAGNPKAFYALMLILQTGMAGTFIAQDLILFFVFFEVVLLPMYFMIGVWGGEQRKYASLKFFLYTMFGSAFMLVAFLALFFQTGSRGELLVRPPHRGRRAGVDRDVQIWIFAGMFLGFAVKVPMFPFHTWLPDAHTQAPTQGSVILAAILLKLGTYGFVRIALPMLPEGARRLGAGHRHPGRDRHHLRLARLPRPDRHEATDRLLVGRPHGLRDARHLHAHRVRHQRRALRHGRPRPDHRHAVLRRRFDQAPLPHARDQAPQRHAAADAEDGLDPRLLVDGVARPARASPASGASSPRSCRPTTRTKH